ncbi:MAG: nitrite/sulfite reductase [Dehalococcoidia bacterium]
MKTESRFTVRPPASLQDIEQFRAEALRLQQGALSPDDFRPFRTMYGIYGQRQKDRYMVRVKVPSGLLAAEQLEVLGRIAHDFSRGYGYVTTRQDIQFHNTLLDDVPTIMDRLAGVGLTTREAGGNSVRNVTCDYMAGICAQEIFDVTPYAVAVTHHFLRHPLVQRLPRKFKVAFSGCPHDHGLTPIHDIGARAVVRDGQRGFQIWVGGGLGAVPRLADLFVEFVAEEELIRTCEAIIRVFNKEGGLSNLLRKNKNKARLKFLLAKLGIDEFRRLVEEELASLPPASGDTYTQPDLSQAEGPPQYLVSPAAVTPHPGYHRWRETNAIPQKQQSYYTAQVTLPVGKITAQQFLALAQICRRFAGGWLRTTPQQNVVLRWVREENLPALHAALTEADLGQEGAETVVDPVACPGADTCMSAITTAKGLARALAQELAKDGLLEDSLVRAIRIKVSGCPNSCGHHGFADIGLYGSTVHMDGRLIPTYELLVGGGLNGQPALGRRVMRIAARRAPQAVADLVQLYRESRHQGESFRQFVLRVEPPYLQEVLAEYQPMPTFAQDPFAYIDWESDKLFSLDERGEGECAV